MPEYNFADMLDDDGEMENNDIQQCADLWLTSMNKNCFSQKKMYSEMAASIDLTTTGIQNIDTGLKEYIKINRQHILEQRDEEINGIK